MLLRVPLVFCYELSQLVLEEPLSQRDSSWDREIVNAISEGTSVGGLWCPHPTVSLWENPGAGSQMVQAVLGLLCEPQAAILALPHSHHILECRKALNGLDAVHILTAPAYLCLGEE